MAGHSHAANVAVRKGKQDRLRAKVFSKLSKNIMIAARDGADPNFNFSLRHAIEKARAGSMPNDKIDHAIKKGAGLIEGMRISQVIYEGYAPGGVAILIEVVTDNEQRSRPEIKRIFEKAGGKLAGNNAVQYLFNRKGLLAVECGKVEEEKLMEIVLEAGAEDMVRSEDAFEITTTPEAFEAVEKALADAKIPTTMADIKMLPDTECDVDAETAAKVLKLVESVEDHDDVNNVHHNMKFTHEIIEMMKQG